MVCWLYPNPRSLVDSRLFESHCRLQFSVTTCIRNASRKRYNCALFVDVAISSWKFYIIVPVSNREFIPLVTNILCFTFACKRLFIFIQWELFVFHNKCQTCSIFNIPVPKILTLRNCIKNVNGSMTWKELM